VAKRRLVCHGAHWIDDAVDSAAFGKARIRYCKVGIVYCKGRIQSLPSHISTC
jgi:hypothetical protein